MSSAEHRVAFDDGAATIVEQWGRTGPVVLCVHGITSSRRSWARLGERLAATHRVVAYDQRGHGDSAWVRGPMTHERSVADLRTVARAVGEPIDLLVGHSWGGAIALLGAPEIHARRALAIDPMIRVAPGSFDSEFVDELRPLFATEGAERDRAVLEGYAELDAIDRDAKLHAMRLMSVAAIAHLGTENGVDGGDWDLRGLLAAYPLPLLLALAGVESVVAADDLAGVKTGAGSNVEVVVFTGEGHNLHRSAFDRFVGVLEEFGNRNSQV